MSGHKRGTCVHYAGYARGLEGGPTCAAGVDYMAKFGPREGCAARAPCLQEYPKHESVDGKYVKVWQPWPRHGEQEVPCEKRRMPTEAEIAADDAEMKASMDRMRVVMTAIAPWRKENPRGKNAVIDCPTKCGGKLHLSQSSYNGHVHGQCTTNGCVSWME